MTESASGWSGELLPAHSWQRDDEAKALRRAPIDHSVASESFGARNSSCSNNAAARFAASRLVCETLMRGRAVGAVTGDEPSVVREEVLEAEWAVAVTARPRI